MKNPFPGMNPFIEGYKWSSFHVSMIVYMQEALIEQLPEGYFLEAETTLYVDDSDLEKSPTFRPDVSLLKDGEDSYSDGGQAATLTPPTNRRKKERIKVRSLQILNADNRELVTSIELLSPANKKGDGLKQYRKKRQHMLDASVNLVEIDLLRGGYRADTGATSSGPYLVQVFDGYQEEILEWSVGLFETLPTIPVPLRAEVKPLVLSLQTVFERTFTLSTLPRSLSTNIADLRPPIEDEGDLKVLKSYLAEIK